MHKYWTGQPDPGFDLFLCYYGDKGSLYKRECLYYDQAKGSKFQIVSQLADRHADIFDQYDAIFVPDDDIFIEPEDLRRFFDIFHAQDLWVAQPSLMGWWSVPITNHHWGTLMRYTNWVEIMMPCFSKYAFGICKQTFMENRTNWGIEILWDKLLGSPQDKIAIVDEVIAIHTRPCFFGDTYQRNNNSFEIATQELHEVVEKHGVSLDKVVYSEVPLGEHFFDGPSENRFFPNCPFLKKKIRQLNMDRRIL